MEDPIQLDGRVDSNEWDGARSLELIQQKPNNGEAPSEPTEILIAYNEDYLYAACRCYDSQAPSVQSMKRDYSSSDTDLFAILLDTFDDNENAVVFVTAPSGLRTDMAINQDAAGNVPLDKNWDSFWQAEATQSEKGWFAEMRIPVSSLRFDEGEGGIVKMGLTAIRFLSRNNEYITYPDIPNRWGFVSHLKPSQSGDVGFRQIEPDPPLRITPYATAGLGENSRLSASGMDYERERHFTYDAGLDVKYGVSSNFTLDLTINTDFAQVEADNEQVNLTRFPLFFPEKRRFFKERASNFAFNFSGTNRLFYSRKIGLYRGEQVRILGGARLVGRSGPWDIGILNMQTARNSNLADSGGGLPSENFGVLRIRRRVFNANSNVGGIFTSRIGSDGSYNIAYGLDGLFQVKGERFLGAKWVQTFRDGAPNMVASLDPARVQVLWENRSYEGLGYRLRFDRAGDEYEPGIGFQLRQNYYRFGDRISYGWITESGADIQRHRLSLVGKSYYRNMDHSLQSLKGGLQWSILTRSGHDLTLGVTNRIEDLREVFPISSDVNVPKGRYLFRSAYLEYGLPSRWDLRARFQFNLGSFYDGHRRSLQVSPTWNASRYLRINGFYQWNSLYFPDRQNELTTHVGRLRVEVTPSVKYSISAFVQYNSAGSVAIGNLRLRYNPRQGNDLYLVYNERLNTDRTAPIGQPRLPLISNRTLLLKYTYTFNW